MTDVTLTGPPLAAWLDAHADELIAFRRALHAHPEPSGEEHATTEAIAERLRIAGLRSRVLSSGTGLICDVGDGPRVALRADIDALAMDDDKEVSYRSQVPGVAHACGHDVHTTIVLGTGLYLAQHGFTDRTGLRLIFQPAEERLPGGALEVIADGGLDDVRAMLGVHCAPKLDVGTVGLRAGAITSAADMVTIRLQGPGGHTARPEETVDMVSLLGRMIDQLPGRVRGRVGADAALKLVFGSVRAGEAGNVIPSHAQLRATLRTPSTALWEAFPAIVEAEVRAMAHEAGAECTVDYVRGVPPVHNDPETIEHVRQGVVEVLGDGAITEAVQSWGGDDFAWFTQTVPAAYIRLGTHDPSGPGAPLDLHAGHFDVDERAIGIGIQVLVAAAERLGSPAAR